PNIKRYRDDKNPSEFWLEIHRGGKKKIGKRKRSIENSTSEHSEQTAPEAPRREIDINVSGFAGSSIRLLRWQPPAQYP
ncbi:hypothetical protein K0M31_004477, partial [Melipona bicolor]